jgi:hypothetical protein
LTVAPELREDRRMLRAALLALVVACHNSPPPTPTPPPGTGDTGSGSSAGSGSSEGGTTQGPPASAPGIAQKCGDNDACAAGLECVHYRGIAGAAGPEFKTCEKRCDKDPTCPEGKRCATIADGPGKVCR